MTKSRTDLFSGIAAIVFAVILFALTRTMPEGPASFPRLIAIGFTICGALLIFRDLRMAAQDNADVDRKPVKTRLTLMIASAWLVLLYSAGWLGFALPGFLFLAFAFWTLMERPREPAELAKILLAAVAVTAVLVAVFVFVLGVQPRGPFRF